MKLLLVVLLVLNVEVFAHGDHSAPGAIPPSPNGGVLSEAKHDHKGSHGHDHHDANDKEIFFEAKLKNKAVSIYPLELDHKTGNVFKALKTNEFKKMKIKVEDPRKKKSVNYVLSSDESKWSLSLKGSRARRLIVHLSTVFNGAKYKSKIQVERK